MMRLQSQGDEEEIAAALFDLANAAHQNDKLDATVADVDPQGAPRGRKRARKPNRNYQMYSTGSDEDVDWDAEDEYLAKRGGAQRSRGGAVLKRPRSQADMAYGYGRDSGHPGWDYAAGGHPGMVQTVARPHHVMPRFKRGPNHVAISHFIQWHRRQGMKQPATGATPSLAPAFRPPPPSVLGPRGEAPPHPPFPPTNPNPSVNYGGRPIPPPQPQGARPPASFASLLPGLQAAARYLNGMPPGPPRPGGPTALQGPPMAQQPPPARSPAELAEVLRQLVARQGQGQGAHGPPVMPPGVAPMHRPPVPMAPRPPTAPYQARPPFAAQNANAVQALSNLLNGGGLGRQAGPGGGVPQPEDIMRVLQNAMQAVQGGGVGAQQGLAAAAATVAQAMRTSEAHGPPVNGGGIAAPASVPPVTQATEPRPSSHPPASTAAAPGSAGVPAQNGAPANGGGVQPVRLEAVQSLLQRFAAKLPNLMNSARNGSNGQFDYPLSFKEYLQAQQQAASAPVSPEGENTAPLKEAQGTEQQQDTVEAPAGEGGGENGVQEKTAGAATELQSEAPVSIEGKQA